MHRKTVVPTDTFRLPLMYWIVDKVVAQNDIDGASRSMRFLNSKIARRKMPFHLIIFELLDNILCLVWITKRSRLTLSTKYNVSPSGKIS